MKNLLTKKMYTTRALFFAVGVMALNVSPIVISTTHAATEQKMDNLSTKLSSIFADKPVEPALFSPQFLGQVSITQIQKIVDDLKRISEAGYAGAALSFVNYNYELPFFCDRV